MEDVTELELDPEMGEFEEEVNINGHEIIVAAEDL